MESVTKLKLVSCEGCNGAAAHRDAEMSRAVQAERARERAAKRKPSKQLVECRAARNVLEARVEELENDLRDAEEERQPDGCYAAVERACGALDSARETLRRWKIGINLKPTPDELAAEIAQMIEELSDLERLY